MPQPPLFVPPYDFSSSLGTQHGTQLDVSFDAIGDITTAISGNLGLIQRDDGALRNQSVTVDTLAPSVVSFFADANGLNPRGPWVTAAAYAKLDLVTTAGVTYVCIVAHTAAALFSTDLAANRWMIFSDVSTPVAGAIGVTPAGNIASTNVQAALQELDNEKAALAGSASQAFSVAAAAGPNNAPRTEQVQGDLIGYCVGAGTGNAITGTITVAGIAAFANGMVFRVRAPNANTITTPTLNLTVGALSSTALTIIRGDTGTALVANDIAGSSHELLVQFVTGTPNKWKLLNPAVTGGVVRYNATTGVFEGNNGTQYVNVNANAMGSTAAIMRTKQTLDEDVTITSGYNAMSVGPFTISSGFTLTVPSGSDFVVV